MTRRIGRNSPMAFILRTGLSYWTNSRRFAIFVSSVLIILMLFVLVGRSPRIVMVASNSASSSIIEHFWRREPPSCRERLSATTSPVLIRLEVYVIFSGNRTDSPSHSEAEINLLKQLLSRSYCDLVSSYYIHVLYYKDLVSKQPQNETLNSLKSSTHRCATNGAVVDLDFSQLPEKPNDVYTLNRHMRDGYIMRNVDYFSVIFADELGSSKTPQAPPLKNYLEAIRCMEPESVGVVFQQDITGSRYFLTRKHFEIFGFFLPRSLPDLRSMEIFLRQVYPDKLRVTLTDSGAVVSGLTPTPVSTLSSITQDLPEYNDTLNRYLSASASNPCLRCRNQTSRMVISMSLYGNADRYTMGAIRNAQLLPVIFPGWRLWFYSEKPDSNGKTKYSPVSSKILTKLQDLGAEIIWTDVAALGLAPMLWRFTVMDNPDVDVFTVRDCDSRLTPRDSAVVADWLKTDKIFHCIRDHPSHSNYAVSGGLWGARRKQFQERMGNLRTVMQRYGAGYVEDMHFLGQDVWPKVTEVAYCHDSFSCKKFPSSHPFPVSRIGSEHLGEVYDEHHVGRAGDINILRGAGVNKDCVPPSS